MELPNEENRLKLQKNNATENADKQSIKRKI